MLSALLKPKASKLFLLGIILLLAVFLLPNKIPKKNQQIDPQSVQTIRQIAKNINEACTMANAQCYQQKITQDLLNKYPTYQILEAIYDYDTYFSCHAFTHFLGRALYQETQSIPDAYSQINFTCHGGSYHGVIEAYLERSNWQKNPKDINLESVCQDSKTKTDKNPQAVFQECLHGFGHAFMFVTNSDLPQSLLLCDQLKKELQEICWGGALMENSTSSTNLDHPTQWLKKDDKFFPCTILSEKYLNQCYFYQANYLIMTTNYDFQKVFEDCYTLVESELNYCIMGIGAILASVSNEQGIKKAAEVCAIGKESVQTICIEGAVPSLMQRHGGEMSKIIEFCKSVTSHLQEHCFAKLGKISKNWHTQEQLEKLCQNADIYKDTCLDRSNIKLLYN